MRRLGEAVEIGVRLFVAALDVATFAAELAALRIRQARHWWEDL